MDNISLTENAIRQFIDSTAIFNELYRTKAKLHSYRGSMYYKQEGQYTYLVRNYINNRQERLGRKSVDTDKTLDAFTKQKAKLEERLKSLSEALIEAERMNKALKVGRVPNIVVALLNTLDNAELSEHFTVVGTHALYAYEAAAGVRIVQGALATQDVDLLWDARKRIKFLAEMAKLDISMIDVLRKVDKTFERRDGQAETAVNAKGFEVDFLRRLPEGDDEHPFRFTKAEDDLWPVQALRANVLTSAPRFEQVVVSTTGKMALMRTIDPKVFVEFKSWMSTSAPNRPEPKRRRDMRQAQIVSILLDEGLLLSSIK